MSGGSSISSLKNGGSMEIKQTCPQGLTWYDLTELFSDEEFKEFGRWMRGQTMSICDGKTYHHDMVHDEYCMKPSTYPGLEDEAHTESSPFNWRCHYTGTGHYEDSECASNPHGIVTYRTDVERFLRGLPVID